MKTIVKNYLSSLGFKSISSLEDISSLIKRHVSTFPFSSAKVLLKDEISLDLEEIYISMVLKKRGGYCFEHNKLMYEVLKDQGFNVEFYLARVVNNSDNIVPLTHRVTLLKYKNKKYMIDVGIGFNTPFTLIDFSNITYSHLGYSYKIKEFDDSTYGMQKIKAGEIYTITKFDLNKCYEVDFELSHFYSYKHPLAVFVNNLVLASVIEDEILSLRNNIYLKIYKEKKEQVTINNIDMFSKIINDDFDLNFSYKEIEFLYNGYVKE